MQKIKEITRFVSSSVARTARSVSEGLKEGWNNPEPFEIMPSYNEHLEEINRLKLEKAELEEVIRKSSISAGDYRVKEMENQIAQLQEIIENWSVNVETVTSDLVAEKNRVNFIASQSLREVEQSRYTISRLRKSRNRWVPVALAGGIFIGINTGNIGNLIADKAGFKIVPIQKTSNTIVSTPENHKHSTTEHK
jgi:hypothetical protein